MEITYSPDITQLIITKEGNDTVVKIRKRYDRAELISFFVVLVLVVGLNVLLHWAQANKTTDNPGVFFLLHIMFKGIGGTLVVGMFLEIIKREIIKITPDHLIIARKTPGLSASEQLHKLSKVSNIQQAPPPQKGWKKTREYSGKFHSRKEYRNDFRTLHPMVQFTYEGEEILFAKGITEEDAGWLVKYIND